MEELAKYISTRLLDRPSCMVFETEMSRVWPPGGRLAAGRSDAIQAFARDRGWSATSRKSDVYVTFKKLNSSDV